MEAKKKEAKKKQQAEEKKKKMEVNFHGANNKQDKTMATPVLLSYQRGSAKKTIKAIFYVFNGSYFVLL